MKAAQESSDASFPIVGIGASAGGLNSLQCFLAALPKKFGFAIIFMQHLSTKHKSLLPDLLHAGRPDIEITEISDGLEIFPGTLYLCPPGTELRIGKGTFLVAPFSEDHVHLPIDEFFVSLAEEAGERAVGVIFSGAGTDGARGVRAIRTMGGVVFVQDPVTAEFSAMPLAAASTGQVDGVLAPEEIAREIVKLHVTGVADSDLESLLTLQQFESFQSLVRKKTGFNVSHYKKSVVGRRIRRRMYLHGISSIKDYIEMVEKKDTEAVQLASDLMIGVTSFFRDKLAWKALQKEAIRKIVAEDSDSPVRVWSPACATGEEPYSIAMVLHNEFALAGKKRELQVFATDVNDWALEMGREGRYPRSVAADVPPDFMSNFFTCSEDGLSVIISKDIRERVVFAKQDLLTNPPFSRLDLIICRNLLIYLEPDAQEKCIALFHYALRDERFLFLGNAESVGRNNLLFKSLGHKKCRIYQKIEPKPSVRPALVVPFASERAEPVLLRQKHAEAHRQSLTEFVQEALLEEYAPAAVAINENYEILYYSGQTQKFLKQPRGAPTQNLLELFPEKLRRRLRGGIYKAAQEGRPVSIRASIANAADTKRQVTLHVSRLKEDLFLIVFKEKSGLLKEAEAVCPDAAVEETAVRQLESELSATRMELQSNIEQLKSLNEELQSSNEELQAANEEQETSREELQSLNEELITVNAQLQSTVEEQEMTNNDLHNFLASTNIPTVFLDHQFRVKRFTPAMSKLIKLLPGDIGRPIIDMSQENLGPELIADAHAVLDHLAPVRKEMRINHDWYVRTTLPYRTSDDRIEGVVITYSDISELKKVEERTKHLASFPQLNPNPVIEVDPSGKVVFSNTATQRILEDLGMEKTDVDVFLPRDLGGILTDPDKKKESSFYREITIKDRIFGEDVSLAPHLNVARIYAYDITERKLAEEEIRRHIAVQRGSNDILKAALTCDTEEELGRVCLSVAEEITQSKFGFIDEFNPATGKMDILAISNPGWDLCRMADKTGHGKAPISINIHGIYGRVFLSGKPLLTNDPASHPDSIGIPEGHPPLTAFLGVPLIHGGKTFGIVGLGNRQGGYRQDELESLETLAPVIVEALQRSRAEAALRESEERLKRTQAISHLGSWELNPANNVLSWSDEVYRIFGLEPQEFDVTYQAFLEAVHPDDRAAVDAAYSGSLREGRDTYEVEHRVVRKTTGEIRYVHERCLHFRDETGRAIKSVGMVHDITERKQAEREREIVVEFLHRINSSIGTDDLIKAAATFFQEHSGCEAVGIRLKKGDDFPYYEARGFPKEFVLAENSLCSRDDTGEILRDNIGNPVLACMCGNIICGRFDPLKNFFSKGGSFWTNSTTTLLSSTSEADRLTLTRNRCHGEGYESVALLPLRAGEERLGLIQLNDRRQGMFTAETIALWERLAGYLAIALVKFRVEDALKRSLKRVEVLAHTASELLQAVEPQRAVESLCRKVMEYLDCHVFFNFLVDEQTGRLHLNAYAGIPEEEAKKIEWLDYGVAVCGCAARDAVRIVAQHIPATSDERTELVKAYGIKAYACHPLLSSAGRVIGTLSFGTCMRETLSEDDLALMKAVTDHVAVAMIRMRDEEDLLKLSEDMRSRNAELEAVNKELEAFIYSISHDLRAPLRSMSGFARFLIEDYPDKVDDRGKDYLSRIWTGAEKMSLLIDDLLHLSKISRQEIVLTEVDISKLASAVVSELRETEPARSVAVSIREGLTAIADPRLMEIMLSNLLGNAWKFTSKTADARIEFGTIEQDGKTAYYVRDNGAGFDQHYVEKMFWPFQRLHSEREFEGSGIGLAIVERIIHRHGGKVWAEGAPGKGATLYFTLG